MTWVLAHGVGVRADLPVPLWLGLTAAAAVLLVSFGVLNLLWHQSRYEPAPPGRPLPEVLQRLADAPATGALLRTAGILATLALLVTLALGPDNSTHNPAPTWFYVWFWVGLLPASLLLGPVWRLLNPLRAVSRALARLSGDPDERAVRPLPARLGWWPAAAGLLAFTWLELCHPDPDAPLTILVFLSVYQLAQLAGAMRYGQAWFDRGDAFEAYSSLIARLAPVGRRDDGRLVWRSPLAGLAGLGAEPGLVAVVSVLLGATVFDGLTQTGWWQTTFESWLDTPQYTAVTSMSLLAAVGLVALTFSAATEPSARFLDQHSSARPRAGLADRFAHSLVPIAVGYTVAHYFSLVILQGQVGYIAASDPLGLGWDLFGTGDWAIQYRLLNGFGFAAVQIGAIVAGHVVGAVAAHDRAVAVFPGKAAARGQYRLIGIMVVYTMAGIALVTAP